MYFKDVPGKQELKSKLINAVDQARIPHAQMMLGREGSGNLSLALALASYIVCQQKQVGVDSCGTCRACIKSHKFIHPDIHFVFPVVKYGKLERAKTASVSWLKEWRHALSTYSFMDMSTWMKVMDAGNSQPDINKQECVEIVQKLGMKTFESDHKVLILWMPEYLRKEGNRLLKIIEEPTPNTVILMVGSRPDEILGTILSRVQISKVGHYTDEEVATYLKEKHAVPEDLAAQTALMAEGNLGQAIQMSSGNQTNYSDALLHWLRTAYMLEPKALRSWIDDMSKWGREQQKEFLLYGLHFFREFYFSIQTGITTLKLDDKEKAAIQKMKSMIDASKLEQLIDIFEKAHLAIQRNANPKIAFMSDSMEIAYVMRGKSH